MTPEQAITDPMTFGAYLRNLWELGLTVKPPNAGDDGDPVREPLDVGYDGDPVRAFRAGFCVGAAMMFRLLDEDDRQAVVDEIRARFAFEIAMLAEGYLPDGLVNES